MNSNKLRGWMALCALVTLVACGGGGGDDGPKGVQIPQGARNGTATPTSNINDSNFRSFAGPLARAVMSAGDNRVPGVSSAREAPQAGGRRMALQGQRWARLALDHVSWRESALLTRPVPCLRGFLTVSLDDNDNNGKLSRGDKVSVTASACVSELGQPASNGAFSLTINAAELDGNDDPTALDVTITFANFEEDGFGALSGSVRLWFRQDAAGGERFRVSYSATAVTGQGDSVAYDFDITSTSDGSADNVEFNGVFVVGGAGYAMSSTTFRFSGGTGPASGSVTLRDVLGNKLTLRAKSDAEFELEFDPLIGPPITIPFFWIDQLLP
jgi:hypothetical protein